MVLRAAAAAALSHVAQQAALHVGKKIYKKVTKKKNSKKAAAYVNQPEEGVNRGRVKDTLMNEGAPSSKVHKKMIETGKITPKATQEAAYHRSSHANEKVDNFYDNEKLYPAKKLMKEQRALTYGKEAAKKTRL